ncbi:DUF421 domain-containing protein [Anaerocolumna sedimenticola]|uniref:DUF421 domain-containing protein n=1 Tax=Anaerocolumna sedimenticola TaxID=2696063 RepID=A0A6P1TR18_9FIRM|nr:DUF421 domain-containing protein [Anaerocolumna sedimenticola]QHQ61975.1 DUF421 domain-containing protein [Anaerocolumna sedimenticola]
MEVLKIIIVSLGSLVILFIFTKLMGKRELSQLSMYDYINSITIGSIAAEMATSLEGDFIKPLTAMIVYGVISFSISYLTCKSVVLRRFFEGHSLLLYQNGQVYEKNLLKAKIDINEFLAMCRSSGYFDLEEIHTALLETNGQLSIIPSAKHRPVTTSDLNLNPQQNEILADVIIDGKILSNNLKSTGKNEKWLDRQLSAHGVSDIKEVILATFDSGSDKLNIYVKLHVKTKGDLFE